MTIISSYPLRFVKYPYKQYDKIFRDTMGQFRGAVDFLIPVCIENAEKLSKYQYMNDKQRAVELMVHITAKNPNPKYHFDERFKKFPSYLRRAATCAAIGLAESYLSNLRNWKNGGKKGKQPNVPKAGNIFPVFYKDASYEEVGEYIYRIKVFINNTWDWITLPVRKSDADYISRHCKGKKRMSPHLQKNGKIWSLVFTFEEKVTLDKTPVQKQVILAVDLGINNACACAAMKSDGTVIGKEFLHLPVEEDSLTHALNKLKKAQRLNAFHTPRLWARVNGINDCIASRTAQFIVNTAIKYGATTIVFEYLEKKGKKRGGKKQRLHLWKSQKVQAIVTHRAHHFGMHVAHVNAWNTSGLAFDGSGYVKRGQKADLPSYSLCRFSTGKIYNCDLNASYNIGARFFIREILKSCSETERLVIEAKVPQCTKRSTSTLSTLISLNAVIVASAA